MCHYPFIYRRVVHFQDTDAAGVVYFASILSICHEAYEAWLAAIGINLQDFFSGKTVAVPIVRTEADFLHPMFCGETYTVHLTPLQLTDSKFKLSYEIFPAEGNQPIGRATTIHICIDPQTRTRTELPTELARQLEKKG